MKYVNYVDLAYNESSTDCIDFINQFNNVQISSNAEIVSDENVLHWSIGSFSHHYLHQLLCNDLYQILHKLN